jgi:7,8-dihydropterin-6-yl-methyl-4-(beta-D-ribofuranosyl)aminobenzene 5'-phosphate synthase
MTMANALKPAFKTEMNLARTFIADHDFKGAWYHLERAHILGQRGLGSHLIVHIAMLKLAMRQSDVQEVCGQILRILATLPGYLFGWVPVGNSGGANVSALKPMAIPDDLKPYLLSYSLWRGIGLRLALFAMMGLVLLSLLFVETRHREGIAQVDQIWKAREQVQVAEFGATKTLKIMPLVNWHAKSPELKTEAGVSYLIEIDGNRILFDLGWNEKDTSPSPLLANMSSLGVSLQSIDTIFFSHAHRDHVGGSKWEKKGSFSLDATQLDLGNKAIFAPTALSYPNSKVARITRPQGLMEGIASTGPITRQLFIGRIDEQALVINVEGKGLVVVVGCGHQTLSRLIQRIEESFDQPIYGIVGDLHYPVPDGRLKAFGVNLQRVFASGNGPTDPISSTDIDADIAMLKERNIGLVALGGHDTSDDVLDRFAQVFGDRFRYVKVGDEIKIQ